MLGNLLFFFFFQRGEKFQWLIISRHILLLLCKTVVLCVHQQSVLHMSFAWDRIQLFNQLARHWKHEDLEEGRQLQLSGIWVLTLPLFSIHSAFQVDIIIDIRPSRKDPEVVKNLILILKCKKSVNWVIKSFDVKGNLKVIVSWLSISLF